jgi:VanZ family protein
LSEVTLRRLWIAAILLFAALIIAASLAPQPVVASERFSDKAGHYFAYLGLALLGSSITSPARLWRTMLRCFLLGAALEVAQALLLEDRVADVRDLVANAAGILTAWVVAGQGRAGWGLRIAARDAGPR